MSEPNLLKKLAKAELQRRSQQVQSHDCESYLSSGPDFEELDFDLREHKLPAKLIAYYLPQFHPFPENNDWWGTGFTEWRNVSRARSRFSGHYQPHLPLDLGYYDLRQVDVIYQQAEMAQKAGIHAWCFYYYRFGKTRLMDAPVNNFLENPDIKMPFCLMWANEDWTRAWDGNPENVLISQDYSDKHDDALVDDWARHFNDPRYLKIDGKPVFYIYRVIHIPDAKRRIEMWRENMFRRHGIEMIVYMAQVGNSNPRRFGLDGAIEFPPHKVSNGIQVFNQKNNAAMPNLNPKFSGSMFRYSDLVESSLTEKKPDFDLVKCAVPCWDNEPRHPNAGIGCFGSTPKAYEAWLTQLIEYSLQNPVQGEALVAINAWNEWAEGAHLEPDVYYGSAYLNATARALLKNID